MANGFFKKKEKVNRWECLFPSLCAGNYLLSNLSLLYIVRAFINIFSRSEIDYFSPIFF